MGVVLMIDPPGYITSQKIIGQVKPQLQHLMQDTTLPWHMIQRVMLL